MPFDVQGARAAGYRDDEIVAYLGYSSGEPIDGLPGTDEEKIAALLHRRQAKMLPVEYADQTPFSRAVEQPPEPPSAALERPDPSLTVDVPEEAVLPSWLRRFGDMFRGPETMPVSGGPVGAGLGGPTVPDIPEAARSLQDLTGPSGDRRAAGASSLARMGMHGAMPLIAPHLGRAPVQTMMGLAYGIGGGMGAEHYLREHGVAPGYAALGGDIFGLGAGAVAGAVPWREVPSRMGDLIRNEAGEIIVSPSKGWTSTLRDLVEQKAPGRVSPQQLASIAAQAPKEEVRWSMGDLARGTEPVAKSEVLGGIRQPEITEVLRTPPDTKFGSYTLPGGEQTSELLLTLPAEGSKGKRLAEIDQRVQEITERPSREHVQHPEWGAEIDSLRAEARQIRAEARGDTGTFRSGHWEEPNVLAHARFNERTTPAGERVLFLEELQSDWHQAGRKEGYQKRLGPQEDLKAVPLGGFGSGWEVQTADGRFVTNVTEPNLTAAQAVAEAQRRLRDEPRRTGSARGVPEAPFSKDWHELVMKRMLREAVDQDYDKLAWTTGEQQAERYDLSKHVSSVEYYKGDLIAYDLNNREVFREAVPVNEIDKHVGKEVADKLRRRIDESFEDDPGNYKIIPSEEGDGYFAVDSMGEKLHEEPFLSRRHAEDEIDYWVEVNNRQQPIPSVSSLDLKVGGEGMKGFYDKMLPDFARKYGKKFGSTVSQSEIEVPGEEIPIYEGPEYTPEQFAAWLQERRQRWNNGTPEGWASWNVTLDRVAEAALRIMLHGGETFQQAMAKYGAPNLADALGGKIRYEQTPSTATVHSMDITPEMRRSLAGGQPMFGSAVRQTPKQGKSLSELAK